MRHANQRPVEEVYSMSMSRSRCSRLMYLVVDCAILSQDDTSRWRARASWRRLCGSEPAAQRFSGRLGVWGTGLRRRWLCSPGLRARQPAVWGCQARPYPAGHPADTTPHQVRPHSLGVGLGSGSHQVRRDVLCGQDDPDPETYPNYLPCIAVSSLRGSRRQKDVVPNRVDTSGDLVHGASDNVRAAPRYERRVHA